LGKFVSLQFIITLVLVDLIISYCTTVSSIPIFHFSHFIMETIILHTVHWASWVKWLWLRLYLAETKAELSSEAL